MKNEIKDGFYMLTMSFANANEGKPKTERVEARGGRWIDASGDMLPAECHKSVTNLSG